MSKTNINLEPSKQLLSSIFDMEISKITETIRRESSDDKDALILKHEAKIETLYAENKKLKELVQSVRLIANREYKPQGTVSP